MHRGQAEWVSVSTLDAIMRCAGFQSYRYNVANAITELDLESSTGMPLSRPVTTTTARRQGFGATQSTPFESHRTAQASQPVVTVLRTSKRISCLSVISARRERETVCACCYRITIACHTGRSFSLCRHSQSVRMPDMNYCSGGTEAM